MMKRVFILLILASLTLCLPVWADNTETGFTIARLVLSRDIESREPIGITNVFTQKDSQAYCFLEATDITENTRASFVWYYNDIETARIELPIRKGTRWRTYSSKKFGVRTGRWRIDLEDAGGNVLESLPFEVR